MNFDLDRIEAAGGGISLDELKTEAIFTLGGRYVVGGISIPQPTAGHFIVLELLDNAFIKGGDKTDYDVRQAVYVLVSGKVVIGAVINHLSLGFDIRNIVEDFFRDIEGYNDLLASTVLGDMFDIALNGFRMLPAGDDDRDDKALVFDSEWLAGYVSVCRKVTGYDADKIIWQMPVCFGGFCVSRRAVEEGKKGVEREKDWKAVFAEIERQAKENAGNV